MENPKQSWKESCTHLTDEPGTAVLGLLTGDLLDAAVVEVVGVSVEAVVTDAGAVVVVGDAEGVGPAERARARVHALAHVAVLQLGADLVVAAVGVVVALGDGRTSDGRIVGVVAFESRGTEALSQVANGVGSALDVSAEVS